MELKRGLEADAFTAGLLSTTGAREVWSSVPGLGLNWSLAVFAICHLAVFHSNGSICGVVWQLSLKLCSGGAKAVIKVQFKE